MIKTASHVHYLAIFLIRFRLLNRSRAMLKDIKENTEFDPGWDERGGLFIARTKVGFLSNSFRSAIPSLL